MIPLSTLLLFFGASLALAIAPGPDNIFVLTQSALHGRKAGLVITLGLCTGLLGHISAVTLGLAALFKTSAIAFTAFKIAGAGYLLYLAWQTFRAQDAELSSQEGNSQSFSALYLRGILMNLTNPKVAIFFLSFLPQFADPARGPISLQIILLGTVFITAALLVFGCVAWAASYIALALKHSKRAQAIVNRLASVIFLSLAFRLALSRR